MWQGRVQGWWRGGFPARWQLPRHLAMGALPSDGQDESRERVRLAWGWAGHVGERA